ncbi:MAG TPA: transglutaminase domain-containing protein [Candidatus Limnocylindrales bacterium]|nr:transglutaminase domain-containing protein [Candidatus Limnocylindrales bacterium]
MKIVNFKLKICVVLLFVVISFIFSSPASASSNFITDYKVIYNIEKTGQTLVNIEISLTNKTSKNFATEYQMNLGFDDISDFKSSDVQGNINAKLQKKENGYDAILPLNRKSVGEGKKNTFNISFLTKSITKNNGDIWDINIPGISNPSDYNKFEVVVKHPDSFGKPTYIKPNFGNDSLIFDKESLGKSGISIGFGKEQNYQFDLTYHLKNPNLYPIKTKIALPPDTGYQRVFIKDINPRPKSISIDQDGNWLAEYSLSPAQKLDITVRGNSIIQLNPKSSELTAIENDLYTRSTKFWQTEDKNIEKLATELKTPERIYDYVVKTLKYDFSRVSENKSRKGAVNALLPPNSAVCREYTDLFIAITRAAGIPSREINGYANTGSTKNRPLSLVKDVLHSWPEYYDVTNKSWIMVDPTWGATTGGVDYFDTLDFDHFAFVVKGESDSYPIPAGGYKSDKERNFKDVKVIYSKSDFDQQEKLQLNAPVSNKYIAGTPININVEITNGGPGAILPQDFHVSSNELSPNDQISEIPLIPPGGKHIVKLRFMPTNILTKKSALFTIRFGDKKIEQRVNIIPLFLYPWN